MKSLLEKFFAILAILLLSMPICFIFLIVKFSSKGNVIYWSKRVGKENKIFKMPKFRTMLIDTPIVAKHLLANPKTYLSPFGDFLRRSSLDEIPQLFSILKGDMSFVGPRPALFNQDDLVALRTLNGVDKLLPGITGWAQVNGRDELSNEEKVTLDIEYLNRQSFWFDLKILWMTLIKVIKGTNVSH